MTSGKELTFPVVNLTTIIEDTFRFQDRFRDERGSYVRSSHLSFDDAISNDQVLCSLRDKVPRALDRARRTLNIEGFFRVLEACIETDRSRKEYLEIRNREQWETMLDNFIHYTLENGERCCDGALVRLNGLRLAKEHPVEAEFIADYLLETAMQVTSNFDPRHADVEPPFRDPYYFDPKARNFSGITKQPNLKGAFAVDILIKGTGLHPDNVARKIWQVGIKNEYLLAEMHVRKDKIDSFVLERYLKVMSSETRQYLEFEHPEVLKQFYNRAVEELSPHVFVSAFREDRNDPGEFGMSLTNSLAAVQKFVVALQNFYGHRDIGRLYKSLTGREPEGDAHKYFIAAFFEKGIIKSGVAWGNVPLSDIRMYLKDVDKRLAILEDLKKGVGEPVYEAQGYPEVEDQIRNLRDVFTEAYKFIEVTLQGIYNGRKPQEMEEFRRVFEERERRLRRDPVIYCDKDQRLLNP